MTLLRLHFLSAFFGLGAVWPLLGVAFAGRGFSPSEYAWFFALFPLARLVASPLWGALADTRFGSIRLLRVNGWLSAFAMVALGLGHGRSATVLAFSCWALFSSSLTPLAEASAYTLLAERAAGFGYVRVFGSIGFALSALGVSWCAFDVGSGGPFLVAALGYAGAALVSHGMPILPREPRLTASAAQRSSVRADVILLWLAATLYGAAHGVFDVYFGPVVRTLPAVPAELIGTVWGVGVLCEVLVVWFMPRVLAGSATPWILPGAAAIAALRWWLLADAGSSRELLFNAPLHGITFGAWYLAFVHENQRAAEPALRATMQGIAAACLGLGVIVATVLGGYALERWGGRRLFELAAALAAASFVLFVARLFLERRAHLSPRPVSGQA